LANAYPSPKRLEIEMHGLMAEWIRQNAHNFRTMSIHMLMSYYNARGLVISESQFPEDPPMCIMSAWDDFTRAFKSNVTSPLSLRSPGQVHNPVKVVIQFHERFWCDRSVRASAIIQSMPIGLPRPIQASLPTTTSLTSTSQGSSAL
jgi:hypothetical protein